MWDDGEGGEQEPSVQEGGFDAGALVNRIHREHVRDFKAVTSLPASRMEPGRCGTGTGLCQRGNNIRTSFNC